MQRTLAEEIEARHLVVDSAEAYIRARLSTTVPMSALCRVAGLSERGLRDCFYRVHGVSPRRWMLTARLDAARQALASTTEATTVTEIATEYGLNQLGRFAATYKTVFGEAPSATLRARGRNTTGTSLRHERPRRCT